METLKSLTGMILNSGALCIDSAPQGEEFVVLAFRSGSYDPYVVWNADQAGNCWRGDYCSSLDAAVEIFKSRLGR